MIAPPDSENERVSCCCQKLAGPKAKKRGASRDVHARYRYVPLPSSFEVATTPSALGAGRGREYEVNCVRVEILRGSICACVLAIHLGFVTMPRVLHVCA